MEQNAKAMEQEAQSMQSIQECLLDEMKNGAYRHAERLPRESVLAERLGISRTQLRDNLAELEREGFITRRQGVGTVINRHVLSVKVRADLESEFMEMVKSAGFFPQEHLLTAERRPAGKKAAARLGISEDAEVIFASRVVCANGRNAIFCEDYIPCSIIKDSSYTVAELEAPIFCFLEKFCAVQPYMDLTEIRAAAAPENVARCFDIAPGAPVLYMDELDYDIDGNIVLYSPQYFAGEPIRHTIMRKKF